MWRDEVVKAMCVFVCRCAVGIFPFIITVCVFRAMQREINIQVTISAARNHHQENLLWLSKSPQQQQTPNNNPVLGQSHNQGPPY